MVRGTAGVSSETGCARVDRIVAIVHPGWNYRSQLYPFKKETVAAGCGCSAPKAFSSKEILCCFVSSPSGSQNFSRHCHFEYQLRILLSTRHYGFHRNEDVFRCSAGPQPSLTAQQSKKRIGILGFQN